MSSTGCSRESVGKHVRKDWNSEEKNIGSCVWLHLNQSIECCKRLKPARMNLFGGHVQHVCHGFLVKRVQEKWDILLVRSLYVHVYVYLHVVCIYFFFIFCPSQSHWDGSKKFLYLLNSHSLMQSIMWLEILDACWETLYHNCQLYPSASNVAD